MSHEGLLSASAYAHVIWKRGKARWMKAWKGRGRQDHPLVWSPVLLRTTGVLALAGVAVMVINSAGRQNAEAPPQVAVLAAKRDQGAEVAASADSTHLISPRGPSRAAGDFLPPSLELRLQQPAAAVPSVDPALLAAAAKRASELTGAISGRTSTPAETVQADESMSVAEASQVGEASPPADLTSERAYAWTEAPFGEERESTTLVAAPPIPQARPEAPPARRQAARRSTRVARAGWPSDPPPQCGKKRARWRYVKDVPTWYCR
jgi:hypothetical protein